VLASRCPNTTSCDPRFAVAGPSRLRQYLRVPQLWALARENEHFRPAAAARALARAPISGSRTRTEKFTPASRAHITGLFVSRVTAPD
jgi:hypothetical protein